MHPRGKTYILETCSCAASGGCRTTSAWTASAFGGGSLVRPDEVHPPLVAIDPRHLATAKSHAGGGQRQEEFVEVETAQRFFELKKRSLLRHVKDVAGPKPRAINREDLPGPAPAPPPPP